MRNSKHLLPTRTHPARCPWSAFGAAVFGAAMLVLLFVSPVLAVTTVWDGGAPAGNSNWNTPANWAGDVVPPASHDVHFASGFGSGTIIETNGSRTVNSIIINTTTPFAISGDTFGFDFLTLTSGNITRQTAGITTIDASLALGQNGTWSIPSTDGIHVTGSIAETTPGRTLTITGAGGLKLSGPGSYTGGTFVSGARLHLDVSTARAGTGPITITSGGTLLLGFVTVSNSINLGSGTTGGIINDGSSPLNGPVTLLSTSRLTTNGPLSINGVISDGPGTFGFVKHGASHLILRAANTYEGPTTVSQGGIILENGGALGTGPVTISSNSWLKLAGDMTVINPMTLQSPSLRGLESEGTATWSGPITLVGGESLINVIGGALTISGNVSGASQISKQGPGELTLSGNNSFRAVNVASGLVRFVASGALPTEQSSVATNAAIELAGSVNSSATAGLILRGSGLTGQGALRAVSGTSTWNGAVDLTEPATIFVGSASQLSIIGGTHGPGLLRKTGPGTLVLAASNSYSGGTVVDSGTLSISSDANLGSGHVTINGGGLLFTSTTNSSRNLTLVGGRLAAAAGAAVTLNGSHITGGFLMGPGTFRTQVSSSLNGITSLAGSNIVASGPTSLNAFINGGNLSGTGITWNGGINNSSGNVSVNSGTLATTAFANDGVININNAATLLNTGNTLTSGGGSRILINPGGTLDVSTNALHLNGALLVNNGTVTGPVNVHFNGLAIGTGSFSGPVTLFENGRFAPGATANPAVFSPAVVPVAVQASFSPASTLSVEIGGKSPGTGFDQVNVAGPVVLAGALDITTTNNFAPAIRDAFEILSFTSRTDAFSTYRGINTGNGLAYAAIYGDKDLTLIATIPGDASLDGRVDFTDLVLLAQNYNDTVSTVTDSWWQLGDFTYDGRVAFEDLVLLAQHYGQSALPDPSAHFSAAFVADLLAAQQLAAVPEPSLCLLIVVPLLVKRRR